MRHQTLRQFIFALSVTTCTLVVTGCSGNAPKQIAAYPAGTPAPSPIARAPMTPEPDWHDHDTIRTAYLELEVVDVDAAAQHVLDLADEHGGYRFSTQSWQQDGRQYTSLVLALPPAQYDSLRRHLLDVGRLIFERTSAEPTGSRNEWPRKAHVTVQLQSAPAFPAPMPSSDWSPARTFERAFSVVASIFQVIADVLIWASVVGGPFLLIGWVLWALIRRRRR